MIVSPKDQPIGRCPAKADRESMRSSRILPLSDSRDILFGVNTIRSPRSRRCVTTCWQSGAKLEETAPQIVYFAPESS